MNLEAIKTAVETGKTVCYQTNAYKVIKDKFGRWMIECGGHRIGLTWTDGKTMNGKPEDFFILS